MSSNAPSTAARPDSPASQASQASLQGPLLAAVSRSFYLSLRFLPPPVRGPLSVSYLLARAADTIADVDTRPAAERLALLADFRQSLPAAPSTAAAAFPRKNNAEFLVQASTFAAHVDHAGERELLERLGECFSQLQKLTPSAQEKVAGVLHHILDGMTLDLERFPDATQLRSLQTEPELDAYTWFVAGCVGEFWTAICETELPGVFTRAGSEMTALGSHFGKGLQLINILRDQEKDAAIGRCYLPLDLLHAAGLQGPAQWPAGDWAPWHRVRKDLILKARAFLRDGWTYAASQRSIRLRFATLMPLLIGEATLDRMAALPPDGPPAAVKVTRPQVKKFARRALWMALTGRVRPSPLPPEPRP
ncbi:MAG: Squalene/phytoene synthase family protein [Verrucomicrobiales bacterium]|nr:Squalene/phytoene synthase family protein [Verrucomicrobiales bacterium]